MFLNEMTKKMPCWGCVKHAGCKILDGFLKPMSDAGGFTVKTEEAISGITFDCKELED